MGVLFGNRTSGAEKQRDVSYWGITSPADLIPRRVAPGNGVPYVNEEIAMRHSAVWASVRLRADLISTLPLTVYRDYQGMQLECPKPPILTLPGGPGVGMMEWLYESEVELDRSGNSFGIIREINGIGLPAYIELVPTNSVVVMVKGGQLDGYRINGTYYPADQVWHEKQYPLAGHPVGLSPVAYAAMTLGAHMSVEEFVANWFGTGAVPRSRLKNVERKVSPKEAIIVKEAFAASQATGEPFVHGADWEYSMIQADKASADWLEATRYSAVDVARFFGVPADLIDAGVSGQSVTYANISQRNLQFLIMNLGPAIARREYSLGLLLPAPRYVVLDANSLLRMDPETKAQWLRIMVESRQLAPSEARALGNRPPFTEDQYAEFERLWQILPPKPPPERI